MIREDDENIGQLPANLRATATDEVAMWSDPTHQPNAWDVPGLLRDAADRIEWLEQANTEAVDMAKYHPAAMVDIKGGEIHVFEDQGDAEDFADEFEKANPEAWTLARLRVFGNGTWVWHSKEGSGNR